MTTDGPGPDIESLIAAALHAKYAAVVCISDQGPHFWEDCEATDQWTGDAAFVLAALAATPEPTLDAERLAEMLHDLDGTQHYVTHETFNGEEAEIVGCATGIEGHMDDARDLLARLHERTEP